MLIYDAKYHFTRQDSAFNLGTLRPKQNKNLGNGPINGSTTKKALRFVAISELVWTVFSKSHKNKKGVLNKYYKKTGVCLK